MKLIEDLAWDITEWDNDADISEDNLRYNMLHTFAENGLALPAAIVCRRDQEQKLLRIFMPAYDEEWRGIRSIVTPFGPMKLKVLPLERQEVTMVPPQYRKSST